MRSRKPLVLRARLEALASLAPPLDAVAGSKEEREYLGRAAAELEKAGLEVEEFTFECMTWREKYAEVTAGSSRLRAVALPYSPPGDIEAEVVHVGEAALPQEWEKFDLHGKIALVKFYRKLDEASWQYLEAVWRGAEAVIFYDRFPSRRRRMVITYARDYRFTAGAPPPVPAVAVSFEDGVRLLRTAREGGEVRVLVEAEVEHSSSSTVVYAGDLSGPVLSAHADKWLTGFTDDVLGVSLLLLLASELRDSAGYIIFGAEESGAPGYSPWYWLWGSRSFAEYLERRGLLEEFGVLLNLDVLGGAEPRLSASGPDLMEGLAGILGGVETGPDQVIFDSFSFTMKGVPAATFHTFPELWGVYHTDVDTPSHVNWEGVGRAYESVLRAARAFLKERWGIMKYSALVDSVLSKLRLVEFLPEARLALERLARLRVSDEHTARALRRALTRPVFRGHYETELMESEVVYPYLLDVIDDYLSLRDALSTGNLHAALRGLRRVPGTEEMLPSVEPPARVTPGYLREYYRALELAVRESLKALSESIAALKA